MVPMLHHQYFAVQKLIISNEAHKLVEYSSEERKKQIKIKWKRGLGCAYTLTLHLMHTGKRIVQINSAFPTDFCTGLIKFSYAYTKVVSRPNR